MGIVAHFHRAALLAISAELSSLVPRADAKGDAQRQYGDRLKDTYRRFIAFTQVYWFDEVSPQQQGRELFERWRDQLRTQALFDEVRQELRDLTDLHDVEEQGEQTREATELSPGFRP